MKTKFNTRDLAYQISYALFCLAFFGALFVFSDVKDFLGQGERIAKADFSLGWRAPGGRSVRANSISAGQFGGYVALQKMLPDALESNASLCLASNNAHIGVWVGGRLRYSFEPGENLTGKGYGVAYHTVNLVPEDAGKLVNIEVSSVFDNRSGGRLRGPYLCSGTDFQRMLVREQVVPSAISVAIIFLSLLAIALHVALRGNRSLPYNLGAMGVSTLMLGLWCLVDTGMLQMLTGTIQAGRVLDYTLLQFSGYPLTSFVCSLTRRKRRAYVRISLLLTAFDFCLLVGLRYLAGYDMHVLVPLLYFSYFAPLTLIIVMLVDNRRYCRKNGLATNLRHFYTGALFLIGGGVADIVLYVVRQRVSNGHGAFLRIGLCLFAAELLMQIFHWWASERISIERDRFINRILQYTMSSNDPEASVNAALEFLGTELHASRAYIFEDMHDGTFDNTYEWCREGVSHEIGNLKALPFEGCIDVWYAEYRRCDCLLIYDVDSYRAVSESMYNILKPQGIRTLVTAPLELNGEYIGFFGLDDPPEEAMQEISEIIRLLSYFLTQMVVRCEDRKKLLRYSYYDSLTGCRNRRAFEQYERQQFDSARAYGFIMCDVNGLKAANDTKGHDAGDALLRDVADSLREVFGGENVYRLGGDEFAVCVCRDDAAVFEAELARTRRLIDQKGRSAAIGAVFRAPGDKDLSRAREEADKRMYADKERYYRGRNDRRR